MRIGSTIDLPLVESGRKQAQVVGEAVKSSALKISTIFSGTLLRTREFGEIVGRQIPDSPPIRTDARLNELDFGKWTNKTDAEIEKEFGKEALAAWNNLGVWPASADWGSSEEIVINELASLLDEIVPEANQNGDLLIVSSNGRLRYFLKLFPGAFEVQQQRRNLSVGTGKICVLNLGAGKEVVELWNADSALLLTLGARSPLDPK